MAKFFQSHVLFTVPRAVSCTEEEPAPLKTELISPHTQKRIRTTATARSAHVKTFARSSLARLHVQLLYERRNCAPGVAAPLQPRDQPPAPSLARQSPAEVRLPPHRLQQLPIQACAGARQSLGNVWLCRLAPSAAGADLQTASWPQLARSITEQVATQRAQDMSIHKKESSASQRGSLLPHKGMHNASMRCATTHALVLAQHLLGWTASSPGSAASWQPGPVALPNTIARLARSGSCAISSSSHSSAPGGQSCTLFRSLPNTACSPDSMSALARPRRDSSCAAYQVLASAHRGSSQSKAETHRVRPHHAYTGGRPPRLPPL